MEMANQHSQTMQRTNTAPRTDEQLLLDYRQHGDRNAFDELVRRYERELYSYLRRYLGDAEMAEDVFQGTFLQVHLKCDQFDARRRFRPWLYRVATNQAIDAQRRNRRHQNTSLEQNREYGNSLNGTLRDILTSSDLEPDAAAARGERRDWIRDEVNRLPDALRGVVALVYYQGLKYREAASVLGVPTGTVKSRLHTALQRLTEAWHAGHPDAEELFVA